MSRSVILRAGCSGRLAQGRGGASGTIRYFPGKCLHPGRADTYPLGYSFPGLVHLFPPGEEGGGRADNNDNDTMALPRGPVPPSRPGSLVNPFGGLSPSL